MAANEFIVKLKADGSNKDQCDIEKAYSEYNTITNQLPRKDRGTFALNVLRILCRNIEQVPSWGEKVDNEALLTLSIECVRGTRKLERADQVKILGWVEHLHNYFVRKNTPIPPELVLKLSYLPFENDIILKEHSKTYWNIVANHFYYIEKLKPKLSITKFLPKLSEHLTRTLLIYNNVEFCTNILACVIHKLDYLYNDSPKELNRIYGDLFDSLTKTDLKSFEKLNEKATKDLYLEFNDCLYYIAENGSRINFKDSTLNSAVQSCIMILGHRSDIYHCFQTLYSNTFCSILTENTNSLYMETVLNSFIILCETTEKLGYQNRIRDTYPFLNQLLRLYMVNFHENFSEALQEKCLEIILFLMEKLKTTDQLWECNDCKIKTGLHNSLRLSLLMKVFIKDKARTNTDSIMPMFYSIVKKQYAIVNELKAVGCSNYVTYYLNVQTDVYKLAMKLSDLQNYKYSIKLLDLYIKNEFKNSKVETDYSKICRTLLNKAIIETCSKSYEKALIDAFLSLIFAQSQGLSNDKYIDLVINIKSKALNDNAIDEDNTLQLMTVLEAYQRVVESNCYGNITPFLYNLKFSILLKYEFSKYAEIWQATAPIAGVWISLNNISKQKDVPWLKSENEDDVLNTLYDIILQTPKTVRSFNNKYFNKVITELLERFEDVPANTSDSRVVYATLLFMKAEFDLSDASQKYNWKIKQTETDPRSIPAFRTIPEEHAACQRALEAVKIWTLLIKELDTVKNTTNLSLALQMAQLFVYQLLYLYKTVHGLQLAYICCQISKFVRDKEVYITSAGTLLYYMSEGSDALNDIITLAIKWWTELIDNVATMQSALVFMSEVAIFYGKCGSIAKAANLVRMTQARILAAYDNHPDIQLELAVGRLLEAQTLLCGSSGSALSKLINMQRHYLCISSTATEFLPWRTLSVRVKLHVCTSTVSLCAMLRALLLWSRSSSAFLFALPAVSAHACGVLHADGTNPAHADNTKKKIDNCLKQTLGLQQTNEIESNIKITDSNIKKQLFTTKRDVETMLQNLAHKKTETSPFLPCASIPAFKTPEFLNHDVECDCYACESPLCIILAGKMCGLESSMYFRMQDIEIAKTYYDGTLKCFSKIDSKLKLVFKKFSDCNFNSFIINSVEKKIISEFGRIKVEILIEAAFFELSQKNFSTADDYAVRIHEIEQELGDIDMYLRNDIMNLMTTSALHRKVVNLPDIEYSEFEFEHLKLSPYVVLPSTPANKAPPPENIKIIVKDDELPKLKRIPIKLNFDDSFTDDTEVSGKKDTRKEVPFKITVPVTSKPVPKNITPKASMLKSKAGKGTKDNLSKPKIVVTQQSVEEITTPKTKMERKFFTPTESPTQFFTPITSVKTYASNSLSVKNLESEFSTPVDEEISTLKHVVPGSETRSNLKVKVLKTQFKITVPATSKPVPKNITPRASMLKSKAGKVTKDNLSKPKIVVTQQSVEEITTPETKMERKFFATAESPALFFTPITSVKTYASKSLSVKNLESEFSTPVDEEKSTLKHVVSGSETRSNLKVKVLKTQFKMTVPATSKPVPKNITPRASMLKSKAGKVTKDNLSKPKIVVTQQSVEEITTPETKMERKFFATAESPALFFTPITSVKTYASKSLSVKNLESEFSTPVDKEKSILKHVVQRSESRRNLKVKALKGAASPGKLERDETTKKRSRRLRKPIKYSLDDDLDF